MHMHINWQRNMVFIPLFSSIFALYITFLLLHCCWSVPYTSALRHMSTKYPMERMGLRVALASKNKQTI